MVCGKLVLNPNVSRAYWADRDVGLTRGECNIVHLLASNAGRWVTYRAIYDRIHYEGFNGAPVKASPKSRTSWASATGGRRLSVTSCS